MPLPRPPESLPPAPNPGGDPSRTAASFAAAGFLDAAAAAAIWKEALAPLPSGSPFLDQLEETWRLLSRAADPDLALRTWGRWVEAGAAELREGGAPAEATSARGGRRAARWGSGLDYREGFLFLAGASPALAAELERRWDEFAPDDWQHQWDTEASLRRRLRPLAALPLASGSAVDELAAALRRFRRLEDLRIAYLDECRRLAVEAVTLQISWLADALVAAALARAWADVSRRLGAPPPPAGEPGRGFAVLAMGKLGSLELNYSSDIDLTFICDESSPPELPAERREAFLARLAERLLALLTDFSDEGQLYRVDARLRPGGSSSRLVWPARVALEYYHSEGRTWERQALIRLRPIAGDFRLSRSFLEELDPFIFRRTLSSAELSELRGLKTQIERLADGRGESESHVKIGRGGIRDVEYIVQYLQLLHGAAIPELKVGNLFQVLEVLEANRLLNTDETDSLRRGYRFLRQVEHRIQLNYFRQTHKLPDDPADLRRIARGLGYDGVQSFRARLALHASRIRRVFRRLFESAAAPAQEEERMGALLELPLAAVAASGRDYLETFGFADPEAALLTLRRLAGEEGAPWDHVRARETFRRLAPRLLREVSQFPDPDRTLANFQEYVATLGARTAFFDLLLESEAALSLILEICGRSTYVIEVLRCYPELFDEVIDAILTGGGFDRAALNAEADRISSGPDPIQTLFELKYLHFLLIAFRDLDRTLNLTATMNALSQVADALLRAAVELADRVLRKRAGPPGAGGLELLVLALGKLGGEELNYRSDLDLVFLYRGPANASPHDVALLQERAHLLAQEVLSLLGSRDQLGPIFKVDVRLRPMGSKNLLAVSFDEFRRYFQEGTAQTWERLAFLRARPVAGDPGLAAEATAFLHDVLPLRSGEDPRALCREIADMRRRLEEAAGPHDFIKRGRGGIVDVEFIAQTLQLLHGREKPGVFAANTPLAIDRETAAELIPPGMAADLLTSYQFLRWLETRLSLVMAPEESLKGMDRDRLRSLIHRIGYRSVGEVPAEDIFEEELEYHRRRNREHLEHVLQGSGPSDLQA